MLKKFKEMTWDMHALHILLFFLGAVVMVVFAVHRDNPKLGGDPGLLIVVSAAFMGTAIISFLMCLFDKAKGQYQNPNTFQDQQHKEMTTIK